MTSQVLREYYYTWPTPQASFDTIPTASVLKIRRLYLCRIPLHTHAAELIRRCPALTHLVIRSPLDILRSPGTVAQAITRPGVEITCRIVAMAPMEVGVPQDAALEGVSTSRQKTEGESVKVKIKGGINLLRVLDHVQDGTIWGM